MEELLAALEELDDTGLIFTMPNADTDGRILFEMIKKFCDKHARARSYKSLGQLRFLSCMRHVDGVIGNSSSGIIEAPSFKKGTINIGDRQKGRLKAESVIDCRPEVKSIRGAIEFLFSAEFQARLPLVKNPYGNGGASDLIVQEIEKLALDNLLKKRFYDIPIP